MGSFSGSYTGTMEVVATPAAGGATLTGSWQHTVKIAGGGSATVSGTLTGTVNESLLSLTLTGPNGPGTLEGSASSNPITLTGGGDGCSESMQLSR
jgi:hypothetical protein